MSTAEVYVTAAYLVFLAILLVYVVVYSFKVAMLSRAVDELTAQAPASDGRDEETAHVETRSAA